LILISAYDTLMKKLVFLFSVIFLAAGVNAQKHTQSILSFGIKQGITLSKINFEPNVSQSLYPGYTGGVAVKYLSEDHAGIQAEFNYSQRGWNEKLDSGKVYKKRLNYLEVPILTQFTIGSAKTKAMINVGPNLSFFQSEKEEMSALESYDIQKYYQRKIDKHFELGLDAGIGILQETPLGEFQIEARLHFGLQNIFVTDVSTDMAQSQNLLYGITITYFPIKKDFWANKKNSK
jgi:hypothetical protein